MATVEIPDVPDELVNALKAQAADRGLTLTAYLRGELSRLVGISPNAHVVERMMRRDRTGGPTTEETVALIRRVRDAS
ncbi:antitoxin [Sphaerisporangium album]|uniref:Antitoxin n=1 Tax=Sphaerisporangium album TaxID=509200 RepID=A0A367FS14_9ACTN|nr:antitoxin [Sphaerisporangium album]RCG32487.1 antitoxin [Sphaerisporangium album]